MNDGITPAYGHRLAEPDKSGQAVIPAVLLPHSLCRCHHAEYTIGFQPYNRDNVTKCGVRYYNSEDNSSLALLYKVWGYLKYYHPSVILGKYNWDAEQIKMMPKVLKSDNDDERNRILSEWITSEIAERYS